jgi:hypothetical protein
MNPHANPGLRAKVRGLERLLLTCLEEAHLRVLHLAADSTDFSSTSASTYYTRIFALRKSKLGGQRRGALMRCFVKQIMAVEMRKHLIVALKFRIGPANDSSVLVKVLGEVELVGQPVCVIVADKG